jgi:ribose transport system ATP-binding protein
VVGLTRKGVFENVNFTLRKGEIVGVAGLVGSGRSEMARAIIGADPLDQGELYIRAQKIRIRSPQKALTMGMGMLPENRKEDGLVLVRPVAENAAYSSVESTSRWNLVPWKQIKKAVKGIIAELNVRYPSLNSEVRYLSGGNQQKVVLARWLAARCDVMVLDEPTRGVDVGARSEIYKLMQELKKDGKAILMISSDLPEILTQADRILVMAKGRIVGEISHQDATEERILSLALQVKEGANDN